MRANPFRDNLRAWPDETRIERAALALRRWTTGFAFEVFPQLARSALAMESSRLAPKGVPEFFSCDLHEIPPTLNEDLLDLYGRSEQVLGNQFAFHNISESLEPDFDWEGHESAAWQRELHSFDYAQTLAMTFRISQEARYAIHLRYLIAHWIAENPPGQATGWQLEQLARRIRNWLLASDLVRAAWQDDRQFLELFAQSLAMQCVFLHRHAPEAGSLRTSLHGARSLSLASRFFGGAAGEEFAASGQALLAEAAKAILESASDRSLPRPVDMFELAEACVEQLVFLSPPVESAGEANRSLTRKLLEALEGTLAPDGTLPLFGPSARSNVDEVSDLFALAAVILDEPRWKNLAGNFGIFPYLALGERGRRRFDELPPEHWAANTCQVPELGLNRLSGGNRSALVVNARPSSSQADHLDFSSYELQIKGLRVIVDSGAYSPEGETWNKYFAEARAHNILLVDGQSPYARPAVHQASNEMTNSFSHAETSSRIILRNEGFHHLGVQHRRAFYCIDDTAWMILDWLTGEGLRQAVNLVHFFPTFEIELLPDRAVARSRALSTTVVPLVTTTEPSAPKPAMKASRGLEADFPGFYSPDCGVKFAAPVLAITSGEVALPWIGGYLIACDSEAEASFRVCEFNPQEGSVSFELRGKAHHLRMS